MNSNFFSNYSTWINFILVFIPAVLPMVGDFGFGVEVTGKIVAFGSFMVIVAQSIKQTDPNNAQNSKGGLS